MKLAYYVCTCDLALEIFIYFVSMSWFKLILTSCYICNDNNSTLSDIHHFVRVKDIAEDVYYIEHTESSGDISF